MTLKDKISEQAQADYVHGCRRRRDRPGERWLRDRQHAISYGGTLASSVRKSCFASCLSLTPSSGSAAPCPLNEGDRWVNWSGLATLLAGSPTRFAVPLGSLPEPQVGDLDSRAPSSESSDARVDAVKMGTTAGS